VESGSLKAYKFLRPGRVGPFSRREWPADGWCDGIYACESRHLALWIWEELWEVELDGQVTVRGHKLHAPRGRLVRRVDSWSQSAARTLAADSARRALDHAVAALRSAGRDDTAGEFAAAGDLVTQERLGAELSAELPLELRRPVGMAGDGATRALQSERSDDPYMIAQGGAVAAYISAMVAWRVGGLAAYDAEREYQGDSLGRALGLV
jgi:hypothetical protein